MTPFWNIAPCSLVEVNGRYRDAYCLHRQGDESLKRLSTCTRLHGAVSQKAASSLYKTHFRAFMIACALFKLTRTSRKCLANIKHGSDCVTKGTKERKKLGGKLRQDVQINGMRKEYG
jgi:hypothetical protein